MESENFFELTEFGDFELKLDISLDLTDASEEIDRLDNCSTQEYDETLEDPMYVADQDLISVADAFEAHGDVTPNEILEQTELASETSDSEYDPDEANESTDENEEPCGDIGHGRFIDMAPADVENFIQKQKNKGTLRKTIGHIKLLTSFLNSKGETRPAYELPAEELNELLAIFFVSVRKDDPDDRNYEPTTLKGIQSSIERYLKENKYPHSIIKDQIFFGSREAIKSQCKELKKQGKGNRPNRKRAPTQSELQKMWSSGALGTENPESLQHTVWWILCTRFGVRANAENHNLRWGDFAIKTNMNGQRYLTMNERSTKTRQGEDTTNLKDAIKVFEDVDNPSSCPVNVFETFKRKRPSEMCQPDSHLYLQPKFFSNKSHMIADPVWYKRQVASVLELLT